MIASSIAQRLLAPLLPWALVAAVVAAGVQTWRLTNEQAAHAHTRATHATELQTLERTAREATEAARKEGARRLHQTLEVSHDTEHRLAQARADAVANAAAGQRLRQQIAALTATCGGVRPGDSAPASAGEAADATADLLAYVQRRLDDAADGIAGFADEAHARGLACERIYGGLMGDVGFSDER